MTTSYCLRFETRLIWRAHLYIPQEQDDPVITRGTGFPFSRLLRLAWLRWRYSITPPRKQVKVKVTLRLAVYRQSLRLGVKPFGTHDQIFFSQLNPCGNSPCVTSPLTRTWVLRSQSQSHFTTGALPPVSWSWRRAS
jgi:hypothetical protein